MNKLILFTTFLLIILCINNIKSNMVPITVPSCDQHATVEDAQLDSQNCLTKYQSVNVINLGCVEALYNEFAPNFQTCLESKELCQCYDELFTNSYARKNDNKEACLFTGDFQVAAAKYGWRFGVGFPFINSYEGKSCDNGFAPIDSGNSTEVPQYVYYGPRTVNDGPTCVPACSSMCSIEQCSSTIRMFSINLSIIATIMLSLYTFF